MAYPINNDVLQLFLSQYRQIVRITVAGQNETFELTENDIIQNGFSVSRYSVSGSALELGSAISSEVDIVLNNKDGRFNATSFEGAELYVEVGIKKWDARRWEKAVVHYVPMGYFTVDNSPRKSQTINLAALDRMMQFAKTVVQEKLVFPTTVGTLLRAICGECGITLATDISTLPNIDQNIPECPDDEDLTYRTLLQWIAQMTGTCAYIDWEGKLRLEWYKTSNPTRLTPSIRYTPADLAENDITITGVELITDDDKTYLCGEETYTLVIEGNKLIQTNHEEILRNIYLTVGNFTYRTFSCNTKPFPHLFPLDMIEWEDADGNVINTALTNYSFSLNCSTALESKGDTETNVSYASSDPLTAQEKTVISKLKTEVSRDITARQQAVLDLNETIANALGLYETRMELNDKSIVCYYHDKPTLAKSTVIYTRNAGGYAWTTGENCWNDGDPTWQYGHTKDGNAIYSALSAYKIQADLLDAWCVTADKIASGSITADKIASGSITTEKISSKRLEGVSICTGDITSFTDISKVDPRTKGGYIGPKGIQYIGASTGKYGRFWVNNEGQMCLQRGEVKDAESDPILVSFDDDGLIIFNGQTLDSVTFSGIGIRPEMIYCYSGNASVPLIKLRRYGSTKGNPVSELEIGIGSAKNTFIGTWYNSSGSSVVISDANAKNSISDISVLYSVLFDGLRPRVYRYNNGTSDRIHTGFIAQEVKEALECAGLHTEEFAGLCISDSGSDNEIWGLRYEEFVALNTMEIQKLKKRISELEMRISTLEEKQGG